MRYRKLGRTNWDVSEIGFGAWGIGQKWWGHTDDGVSRTAIRAAWDEGITFFDTAYVYGDGHSEELLGEVLEGKPALIATKIPPKDQVWPGRPETPVQQVFPKDWIISCTERSLKKLRRETLDLTQFHVWTDAWLHTDEWKRAVSQLKKDGKIRAFGVSLNNHEPDSALELVASGVVDSVQVIFNIFDQSPIEKLFTACRKHYVGVIVRVPLDEGGLSGTLTLDTKFVGDDFRKKYFAGEKLKETVEHADRLKSLLGGSVSTLPEMALRFVLSFPDVTTVIPGMRTPAHVKMNAAVSEKGPLDAKLLKELKGHAWPRNFYGRW